MTREMLFVFIDQPQLQDLAVGDDIKVSGAFGRRDYRIAFIDSCDVKGQRLKQMLPRTYAKTYQKFSPVDGKVSYVDRVGNNILVGIA